MKKGILVSAVVLLAAASMVQAQESELHGTAGVEFGSKYIWRGFAVYGADTAIHPFVDLDLFGSGFHIEAIGHRANAGGNELSERWDYALYYAGAVNPEQCSEMRYMAGYRYFNYPELSSHRAFKNPGDIGSVDLQELFAGFSFPRLLGVPGLVPTYVLLKTWPGNSGTIVGSANPGGGSFAGWAHVFMLDYALSDDICPVIPGQTLNLHAETVFNDSVDPRPGGGYTDSDWTHVLFGVSTDFALGAALTLTPGINYQVTFEDNGDKGVSPDHDILWASVKLTYKF